MSWKKHFRVVPPIAGQQTVVPNAPHNPRGGDGSSATTSKYSSYLPEVYAGHPNRIQRYYQYEDMDRDSDISVALDTIADFCTQSEEQSDEPFEIRYIGEASETEVKLLKASLEKWTRMQNFRSRLWFIFRNTIKNGDAFFLRDPETGEWLWVDQFSVLLVKVDEENGKKPEEYIVRGLDYAKQGKFATGKTDASSYNAPLGTTQAFAARQGAGMGGQTSFSLPGSHIDVRSRPGQPQAVQDLHVLKAEHMVHLSLSVGMDVNWPFGQSVMEPIFKTYKQKELLEDSIIIYRVQRAPERRIFYVDVGTMPPVRAKAHIQAIKNEIHQKRIPNRTGGGTSIMDAAYNPLSIMEDYFFAQCLRLSTQIPLLDGRTLTLGEIIKEFEEGKVNYTYSINTKTHVMEPGKITWGGVTRRNAQMVRVTLDNGEHVDATPDHRFILRDGSEVEAKDLQAGVSLMPLYRFDAMTGPNQKGKGYTRYTCNATGKKRFVHLDVCPKPKGREFVVHHKDFDARNNSPSNLEVMTWADHEALHKAMGSYSLTKQWSDPVARQKLLDGMRSLYANGDEQFYAMLSQRNSSNGKGTWAKPESAQRAMKSLRASSAQAAKRRKLNYSPEMFSRMVELYNEGFTSITKLCPVLRTDEKFQAAMARANEGTQRDKGTTKVGSYISDNTLVQLSKVGGYEGWDDFKRSYARNHKVVSVVLLDQREDTGDITVESASDSHVFAVAAGVYVHNSAEGRGSKVETLPGGDNLGEIGDLDYFTRKLARGLRIPSSYLALADESANVSYNDGKLGAAIIQEFRFNKYCMRLQNLLAPVFDAEFKHYVRESGISVENELFELRFNPPQNFTKYRQIEIDAAQAGVYQQVADNKKLAERFKLKRFLNLSDEEIVENERMWKEENAARLKKNTGAPASEDGGAGLSSIGIRPGNEMGGEFGMDGEEVPVEGEGLDGASGGLDPAAMGGSPGQAPGGMSGGMGGGAPGGGGGPLG